MAATMIGATADSLKGQWSGPVWLLTDGGYAKRPVYAAIKLAASNAGGFFCQRSDDITKPGRISLQILQAIGDADLIVADLSEHNPNVMYELGFAHALGKPTILLAPARFKSPV